MRSQETSGLPSLHALPYCLPAALSFEDLTLAETRDAQQYLNLIESVR
jgi:hypothetical protein